MSEDEANRIAARDAVIQQIETAFDGVIREGVVSLHQVMVVKKHGSDEEFEQAASLDTESRWQDVPDADIERFSAIFCYPLPVNFRYYLPAYMIWTLNNYSATGSMTPDFTIGALKAGGTRPELYIECYEALSRPQKEAICAFLIFLQEYPDDYIEVEDVNKVFHSYWERICSPT